MMEHMMEHMHDGTRDGTHDGTHDRTHDGTHDGTHDMYIGTHLILYRSIKMRLKRIEILYGVYTY